MGKGYSMIIIYMHIDITTKNIDLTDALRNRVESELAKLEKITKADTRIYVEIGKINNHHKQGDIYKAEGKISSPGSDYFAEIVTDDLYTAIGDLGNELFSQINESKSRSRALIRKGQSIIKKLLRLS
jgi:ribosomal subunit interface protein